MNLLEFMTGGAPAAAKTSSHSRTADRIGGDGEAGALFAATFSEKSGTDETPNAPFAVAFDASVRDVTGRYGVSGPLSDGPLIAEQGEGAMEIDMASDGAAIDARSAIFSDAKSGLVRDGALADAARIGPGGGATLAESGPAGVREPLTKTASPLSAAATGGSTTEETSRVADDRGPRIVFEGPDGRARATTDANPPIAAAGSDAPAIGLASEGDNATQISRAELPDDAKRVIAPQTAGQRAGAPETAATAQIATNGPVRKTAPGLEAQTDEIASGEPVEIDAADTRDAAADRRDVFQRAGDPRGAERIAATAAPIARPAGRANTAEGDLTITAEHADIPAETDALSAAETRASSEPSAPSAGAELARGQAVRIAPEARAAIERALGTIERGDDGVIEIALDPPELGKLKISYEMTVDGLTARVSAQDPASLELLRRHADTLLEDLRDLGFENIDLAFSGGEGRGEEERPSEDRSRAGPNGDAAFRPETTRERSAITVDGLDIRI